MPQSTNQSLAQLLKYQPLHQQKLSGKFHAHLSVATEDVDLTLLMNFCQQRRVKLTVIDLENYCGRTQSDVMTTSHYSISESDAVEQITQHLLSLTQDLTDAGYSVLRAKLEHESLPTLDRFSESQYHEVHIKLRLSKTDHKKQIEKLKELGSRLGFVPSRNPLERNANEVIQFVNLRMYSGDRESADQIVESIVSKLENQHFAIKEIKRETVVYDTRQDLDDWWTR